MHVLYCGGATILAEAAREVQDWAGLGAASLTHEQRITLQQQLKGLRYPSMQATPI